MTSSYVNDLRLNEMATGDASGTWGTVTNTNLELIGEALGYGTEPITTNADTHTSTVADGAADPARAMFIKYTGTLDSTCTITIAPNTLNRLHFIHNATSGSQSIIIKQGSGATITIPTGDTKAVYLDGAGSGAAVTDAFASLSVVDLKVQDDLTVTDDMTVGGTLGVTGVLTATSLDISGDIDVDGTTNLDAVDIDGAVDMASTLQVDGVATFSATSVFSEGIKIDADNGDSPQILFENSDSVTTDGAISTFDDSTGTMVVVGSNFYINSSGSETRFNTSEQSSAIMLNRNGELNLITGDTGATGTTRLKIDSSGNVGIGASSSGELLEVHGDTPVIKLRDTSAFSAGTGPSVQFQGKDSNEDTVFFGSISGVSNSANNGVLTFETRNSGTTAERMRIDSSGNVAIGQSDVRAKLSIGKAKSGTGVESVNLLSLEPTGTFAIGDTANITFHRGSTTTARISGYYGDDDASYGELVFSTRRYTTDALNEGFRLDNRGRVGIGTASPARILHLEQDGLADLLLRDTSSYSAGTGPAVIFQGKDSGGTTTQFSAIYGISNGSNSGELSFETRSSGSSAERMRIDSSGNFMVGITTTSGTAGMYINQSGTTVVKSADANATSTRFQWESPVFDAGNQTKHGIKLYNGTDTFEFGYISDSGGSQGAFIDSSSTDLGTIIRSDSAGVRLANGGTSWSSYSDSNLKNITGEIPNALNKIDAMRGVLFSWKDDEENTQRCGVIAQEVQAVLPEVIDADTDYLQVRYSEMIPLLIQGIKEQQATIETLTARITALEGA